MKIWSAVEVGERLPYPELADALGVVLRRMAAGELVAPKRIHAGMPGDGTLLVMPAVDESVAVTKLVTVSPGNPALGLPLIQGEVVVMDALTGERLALLDGPAVTVRRTAALSLLAARTLAPRPEGPLLIVGAGAQARGHMQAFADGLGVRRVWCCSRSGDSARLMAEFGRGLGLDAQAVATLEEVLGECSLVVTATTSPMPVLPEAVAPGTFIAAVGAFRPEAAEIPPALVRACRVVVDTTDACSEAGDLIDAGMTPERVGLLADALAGAGDAAPETAPGVSSDATTDVAPDTGDPDRPVLFKSTGHALFDLAAARLAVGR